jgi:hypothetical protein
MKLVNKHRDGKQNKKELSHFQRNAHEHKSTGQRKLASMKNAATAWMRTSLCEGNARKNRVLGLKSNAMYENEKPIK